MSFLKPVYALDCQYGPGFTIALCITKPTERCWHQQSDWVPTTALLIDMSPLKITLPDVTSFLAQQVSCPTKLTRRTKGLGNRKCLFATFGGNMIAPLVVKDFLSRGSPIFSQLVANRPPCLAMLQVNTRDAQRNHDSRQSEAAK